MTSSNFAENLENLYEKLSEADYKQRVCTLFCMWNGRLLRSSYAHYSAASNCQGWETFLSVVNISAAISVLFLISNVAASEAIMTYFFGAEKGDGQIIISVLSVLVVLSSAAQYILQLGNRASLHKLAGNEFSNLRRKVERYWSRGNIHPEAIHALNRAYNMISKAPPLVPRHLWRSAERAKKSETKFINEKFFGLTDALSENDAGLIHTFEDTDLRARVKDAISSFVASARNFWYFWLVLVVALLVFVF